jgi:hypothetical protein
MSLLNDFSRAFIRKDWHYINGMVRNNPARVEEFSKFFEKNITLVNAADFAAIKGLVNLAELSAETGAANRKVNVAPDAFTLAVAASIVGFHSLLRARNYVGVETFIVVFPHLYPELIRARLTQEQIAYINSYLENTRRALYAAVIEHFTNSLRDHRWGEMEYCLRTYAEYEEIYKRLTFPCFDAIYGRVITANELLYIQRYNYPLLYPFLLTILATSIFYEFMRDEQILANERVRQYPMVIPPLMGIFAAYDIPLLVMPPTPIPPY